MEEKEMIEELELVSIIVPVYNVEQYLENCVESLIEQTYHNIEIILVDDGSTDKSKSICDQLKLMYSNIQVVHKENGGLSDARNVGMMNAKGNYYVFVDSDDFLDKKCIEVMYSSLKSTDSEIAVCNMIRIYEDQTTEPFYCPNNELQVLNGLDRFETLKQPSVCNKMFQAKLFENVEFPLGKYYEDTFVYHILADKAKRIVLSGNNGYWYRSRKDSILGQPVYTDRYFDFLEAVASRMNFLLSKNIQPYANEACLSLYAAYANAIGNIRMTSYNKIRFKNSKEDFLIAYKALITDSGIGIKQRIRLVLLRYAPSIHKHLY